MRCGADAFSPARSRRQGGDVAGVILEAPILRRLDRAHRVAFAHAWRDDTVSRLHGGFGELGGVPQIDDLGRGFHGADPIHHEVRVGEFRIRQGRDEPRMRLG
jgi:hypothetical protein